MISSPDSRRDFLLKAAWIGIVGSISFSCFPNTGDKKYFKKSLNPGAIGVQLNPQELLDAAYKYGFEAVVPPISEMKSYDLAHQLNTRRKEMSLSWDAANLPVEFRKGGQIFKQGLEKLKNIASLMQNVSIEACSTWIMPTHSTLTYLENFNQHKERIKQVAQVLGDQGLKLGLEYVGPKTLMSRDKHPFISSLKELQELIDAIGQKNIGVQLDSFHWFCAEENEKDLLSLSAEEIITCDLNDAVKGRSIDQQLDYERELPMATNVIDIKTFLEALVKIGYNGAIRVEPFNADLNVLNNQDAIKKTGESIEKAFMLVE